jgi:sugar phosphate isomerase/epimerase
MADAYRFKLSVCNELYEQTDFAESCRSMKRAGWDGIEIAPFTLQKDASYLPAERRREVRDIILSEGLEFVGLHWLTVGPDGLHVTTPDEAVRKHSWDYVRRLVDLCGDLSGGAGAVMVFGSPNQRKTTGGLNSEQAKANYIEGVRSLAPQLEARGVTFCVEALPRAQCDVILSLDEAVEVVEAVGSPNVQTMFDSHNAIDEVNPHAEIVTRHWNRIRHIHVNELDGSYPRPDGGYDFKPVLQIAKDRAFPGWVSMEVFDFTPGAEKIVNESIAYLRNEIEQLD